MRPRLALLAVMLSAADVAFEPPPPAPLPEGAVFRLGTHSFRTPARISCSTFSRDRKFLAVGTHMELDRGHVVIFDAATGAPTRRFTTQDKVRDVSFSKDGRSLAFSDGYRSIGMYDVAGDRVAWRLPETAGSFAQFMPDGETVAAGREGAVVLADRRSGEVVRELKGTKAWFVVGRASDDGARFAGASADGTVTVWDVKTGAVEHALPMSKSAATGLAFSPDGSRLAATDEIGNYAVWDLEAGKELWRALSPGIGQTGSVSFTADGAIVIGLPEYHRREFDAATGQAKPKGRSDFCPWRVDFSADRKWCVPSGDYVACAVDSATHQPISAVNGHRRPPTAVAFAEGGAALYTGSGEDLCRWDAATGARTACVKAWAEALAVSPAGDRLAGSGFSCELGVLKLPSLETTVMYEEIEVTGFSGRPWSSSRSVSAGRAAVYTNRRNEIEAYGWDKAATGLKAYKSDWSAVDSGRHIGLNFAVTPDGRTP